MVEDRGWLSNPEEGIAAAREPRCWTSFEEWTMAWAASWMAPETAWSQREPVMQGSRLQVLVVDMIRYNDP